MDVNRFICVIFIFTSHVKSVVSSLGILVKKRIFGRYRHSDMTLYSYVAQFQSGLHTSHPDSQPIHKHPFMHVKGEECVSVR